MVIVNNVNKKEKGWNSMTQNGKGKTWIIIIAILLLLYLIGSCGQEGPSGGSYGSSGKTARCNYCNGTGRVNGESCPWCGGSGRTYDNYFNDALG